MAVSFDTFKNPKILLLGGVFVVAGIYLSSRINKKKNESTTPIELTPSTVSVVSADTLQREDSTLRELTSAKDKYSELERANSEAQLAYSESLKTGIQTERDQFNQRLLDQKQELGTAYSSQLSSLQSFIDKLEAKITASAVQVPAVQNPYTPAVQVQVPAVAVQVPYTPAIPATPIIPTATARPIAVITPVIKRIAYPGLPDNYKMNCDGKPTDLRFSTFEAAVNDQKKKNIKSATFLARNMVTIAISGGTSPWHIGYDATRYPDPRRREINERRVHWGLMPLTEEEMTALSNHMKQLWEFNVLPAKQSERIFTDLNAYAKPLWLRWNLPYQCGSSQRRF